jgi:hypothetical protein
MAFPLPFFRVHQRGEAVMKTSMVTLFGMMFVLVGSASVSAQARSSTSKGTNSVVELANDMNIGGMRTDSRVANRVEFARACRDEFRRYEQRRLDLVQRLRQQHVNWHRAHSRNYGRDWTRQHNQLHERLEREYVQWERTQRRQLSRCDDEWDTNHDWDDRRYRYDDAYDNDRGRGRDEREDWRYDNRRDEREDRRK